MNDGKLSAGRGGTKEGKKHIFGVEAVIGTGPRWWIRSHCGSRDKRFFAVDLPSSRSTRACPHLFSRPDWKGLDGGMTVQEMVQGQVRIAGETHSGSTSTNSGLWSGVPRVRFKDQGSPTKASQRSSQVSSSDSPAVLHSYSSRDAHGRRRVTQPTFATDETCRPVVAGSESATRGVTLLQSKTFRVLLGAAITLSTALIGCELDYPQHHAYWFLLNCGCGAVFSFELLMRIIDLKSSFFMDRSNLFELFLFLASCHDVMSNMQVYDVRSTYGDVTSITKILRVFRLGLLFPQLHNLSSIFSQSVRSLMWGWMLLMLIIYVTGAVMTILVRDSQSVWPQYHDNEDEFVEDFNPFIYFGSVPRSMFTIFNLAILVEYTELARYFAIRQPLILFFIVCFVVFIVFGISNFIVTVSIEQLMDVDKEIEEEAAQIGVPCWRQSLIPVSSSSLWPH